MERSKDWMDQAVGDLEHGQSDMDRGFYNWACFSSQQAAEKAVKAVFQKMGGGSMGAFGFRSAFGTFKKASRSGRTCRWRIRA
jgi:HEPN domain-containing protein